MKTTSKLLYLMKEIFNRHMGIVPLYILYIYVYFIHILRDT